MLLIIYRGAQAKPQGSTSLPKAAGSNPNPESQTERVLTASLACDITLEHKHQLMQTLLQKKFKAKGFHMFYLILFQ